MHHLRSGRLQYVVDLLATANFGTPALRLHTATNYSREDLNLVTLDLTLFVLTHKYTDLDLFDLIHSKEFPTVPDLLGML